MKILFTICGRAGSKGIKNKNIRNFLSKPLPLYTLSVIDLFLNNHVDLQYDVAINSDSPELINILKIASLREVNIIERKEHLAGDKIGKVAVVSDCLNELAKTGQKYDMVMDLDITAPLRRVEDLENVFNKKAKGSYDVVFTVTESRRNPYFNMVKQNEKGYYDRVISANYTARQQAPVTFDMNASIYAYDPEFLKSGKNIFEGRCGIIEMTDTGVLDLDHENDFVLMEAVGKYLVETSEEFSKIRDNINWK